MQKFTARYFKRNGEYFGYTAEFGPDAMVTGRSLAEVKAKLREIIPDAARRAGRNKINGKNSVEETISVDIR